MRKFVLISCCSQKLDQAAKAEDLYVSQLFRKSLQYARSLTTDEKIFILSAKHHLVRLDQRVEPYDLTLNAMPIKEIRDWAETVLGALKKEANLTKDEFTFLAGVKYRKFLVMNIPNVNVQIPMKDKRIGEQLHFLTDELKRIKGDATL